MAHFSDIGPGMDVEEKPGPPVCYELIQQFRIVFLFLIAVSEPGRERGREEKRGAAWKEMFGKGWGKEHRLLKT